MNPSTAIRVEQSPFPKFNKWEEVHEPRIRQYVGEETAPDYPLELSDGPILKDLQSGVCFLETVTTQVKDVIEACGLTGIRTVPHRVLDSDLVDVLHRLVITGRCGKMTWASDPSLVNKWKAVPVLMHYFDIETWDGSDVFVYAPLPSPTVFTDRAVKCLRKHKVKLPLSATITTDLDLFRLQFND
jgi:hypothetical protein